MMDCLNLPIDRSQSRHRPIPLHRHRLPRGGAAWKTGEMMVPRPVERLPYQDRSLWVYLYQSLSQDLVLDPRAFGQMVAIAVQRCSIARAAALVGITEIVDSGLQAIGQTTDTGGLSNVVNSGECAWNRTVEPG